LPEGTEDHNDEGSKASQASGSLSHTKDQIRITWDPHIYDAYSEDKPEPPPDIHLQLQNGWSYLVEWDDLQRAIDLYCAQELGPLSYGIRNSLIRKTYNVINIARDGFAENPLDFTEEMMTTIIRNTVEDIEGHITPWPLHYEALMQKRGTLRPYALAGRHITNHACF
jgi:hypothetical protein